MSTPCGGQHTLAMLHVTVKRDPVMCEPRDGLQESRASASSKRITCGSLAGGAVAAPVLKRMMH